MKLKQTFFTILIGLVLLLNFACKKEAEPTSNPTASNNLANTWSRTFDTIPVNLIFKSDNSYQVNAMGITIESGTYTKTTSSVTVTATFGDCSTFTGNYNYIISGSNILFNQVNDGCDKRILAIPGNWIKQ